MSNSGDKLTALIITFNEMEHIKKCIFSVSFADEIIVVDSYSTDGTFEYLETLPNVRVIQRPFKNFTDQKSFTLDKASNDWVLFVDADEIVPSSLRKEISQTIKDPNALNAYWFYRKFMFKNSKLNYSGWQTDKNIRLFKKSKCQFAQNKLVHETLQVNGKTGVLKEKLTHYCYKGYSDYKAKMVHYGKLKAKELYANNRSSNLFKLIGKPSWKFAYNYIIRLGFIDLRKGFTVCYLNALSVYVRYDELSKLKQVGEVPQIAPKKEEYKLKNVEMMAS
ncbi:glycosyltransferase family 2 protein [Zobellia uliginosa]|uniref:glycosyltransferase family 2 protein n=1 Tax=Zobellia uliginosa TaxID=143224 RepID=UPI001C076E98|nr:glycosyltransferase family 2 protein [Zobellia uliginosa]MBU2945202.1 glycosyltransferase family 2 protein [Zobellia uliginosa]